MKDYSFGDKKYQEQFILKSYVTEDYDYIIVHFANGKKEKWPNTCENQRFLLERKKDQIQKAYDVVQSFQNTDYSGTNIFEYIKNYISIGSKANDVIKNKIWLDNLEYIKKALLYDMHWVLDCSIHMQNRFIWNWKQLPLTVDTADEFTLKEINDMLHYIDEQSKTYVKFPKRNPQIVSE